MKNTDNETISSFVTDILVLISYVHFSKLLLEKSIGNFDYEFVILKNISESNCIPIVSKYHMFQSLTISIKHLSLFLIIFLK